MKTIRLWVDVACYLWCVMFVRCYQTDPLYMEMLRTDQFVGREYKNG